MPDNPRTTRDRICEKCGTWVYFDNGDCTFHCLCGVGWKWSEPKTTQVLNLVGAAGLGALALLVTLYQPDVAWVVSQNMVDCGIRIAPGVTASISDATVIGHDIGVCIGDTGSAHIGVDARPE